MGQNRIKVYVSVLVEIDTEGAIHPVRLTWENGEIYKIDKVTDIRQAAAMRAGGQGDRYTVWINGKQSYLFFERSSTPSGPNIGRWFVERKAG